MQHRSGKYSIDRIAYNTVAVRCAVTVRYNRLRKLLCSLLRFTTESKTVRFDKASKRKKACDRVRYTATAKYTL